MTDQPVIILRTLSDVNDAKNDNIFPGAHLVSAAARLGLRTWTAREIYVEEGAATPEILGLARGRQKSYPDGILEVLPDWQIQARFMSAHDAFLTYEIMRRAGWRA